MVASVKVIHGANDRIFRLPDDTTVFSVGHNLAEAFNIPPQAIAFVNGRQAARSYRLRGHDILEFVVPTGRKGARSRAECLAFIEKHFPLETWDEEKTLLKQSLFLDGESYQQTPLFELPPVEPAKFSENFLVSQNGSFAYQNRVLPSGHPLVLHGVKDGLVVFKGDVIPSNNSEPVLSGKTEPFVCR